MKKPQLKLIEIIANNLPEQGQVSNINTLVTGQELKEDVLLGGRKESDIKEVEPDWNICRHCKKIMNEKLTL